MHGQAEVGVKRKYRLPKILRSSKYSQDINMLQKDKFNYRHFLDKNFFTPMKEVTPTPSSFLIPTLTIKARSGRSLIAALLLWRQPGLRGSMRAVTVRRLK